MESTSELLSGDEETLDIPSTLLKDKVGFGFDIGGSLIKLVYTTSPDDVTVRFHFVSFPREQLDQAVNLVINNCKDFDRTKPIITCGVGGHQFADKLRETLSVKTTNVMETDSFVRSFCFLTKNLSSDVITYPPCPKAKQHNDKLMAQIMVSMEAFTKRDDVEMNMDNFKVIIDEESPEETGASKDTPLTEGATGPGDDKEDVTPDMLCMVGSGTGFLKVERDGSHQMTDGNNRGGRMFLGLGSLLTGAKSYEELIGLAMKGDNTQIDTCGKHMKVDQSGDDVYSTIADDVSMYCFGRSVWKSLDDFRREDVAAACLSAVCQDTVQSACYAACVSKARAIYFCGSLPGLSQTVRTEMEKACLLRFQLNMMQFRCEFHFLKYGGYLGAFGCLLKYLGI